MIAGPFSGASAFHDGLAPVFDATWKYIDKTGKLVIPAVFESSHSFADGLAEVSVLNGNMPLSSVIDRTGKPIWMRTMTRPLGPKP